MPSALPANNAGRATNDADAHPAPARSVPFQRSLDKYPLRSRNPSALLALRARASKPHWGRGTGCAFAINNVSTDP
eukprot:5979064-Pleurochrysis_carterae.AAC.1